MARTKQRSGHREPERVAVEETPAAAVAGAHRALRQVLAALPQTKSSEKEEERRLAKLETGLEFR